MAHSYNFISRAASALRLLRRDPQSFFRKLHRRANLLVWRLENPLRKVRIGEVSLELDLRNVIERSVYAELYEVREVEFLRASLKRGQTVIDVGANIGYFAALAADCVGTAGEVHAWEPVPQFAARLDRLATLNPRHRIFTVQKASGSSEGAMVLSLSNDGNTGWNTLVPGFMPDEQIEDRITVEIERIDRYIERCKLTRVDLIKIDAEGFELPVLMGSRSCLERYRPIVLCEIAPSAYPLMGFSIDDMTAYVRSVGYRSVGLDREPVDLRNIGRTQNVLLLPRERGL